MSIRFLAPQIPGVIFAQCYSGPKRKGMTDEGFLDKIDGPFICLQPPYYVFHCDVGGLASVSIMWLSQGPLPGVRKTMCTGRFRKCPDPPTARASGHF